jgi:hypothetical protein
MIFWPFKKRNSAKNFGQNWLIKSAPDS